MKVPSPEENLPKDYHLRPRRLRRSTAALNVLSSGQHSLPGFELAGAVPSSDERSPDQSWHSNIFNFSALETHPITRTDIANAGNRVHFLFSFILPFFWTPILCQFIFFDYRLKRWIQKRNNQSNNLIQTQFIFQNLLAEDIPSTVDGIICNQSLNYLYCVLLVGSSSFWERFIYCFLNFSLYASRNFLPIIAVIISY